MIILLQEAVFVMSSAEHTGQIVQIISFQRVRGPFLSIGFGDYFKRKNLFLKICKYDR